ncbi:MAG: PAS domain-containing protein [Gemmatimonadaceae bacterium]
MPRTTPLIAPEYGPASVSRRRLGNLAVFLVVGSLAAAIGYLPWEVPALLVPWIGGVWLAGHLMYRASSSGRSQWIETASYCLDALWLTAVCFYLGGADWIASAFYVLLVITAAASLPMAKAGLVAVVAWAGFAWLSLGEAMGTIALPEFGAAPGNGIPIQFAVLTVVVQGTTLALALLLQQALLGALRRSEARHRAILGAASDMVIVLDGEGIIQGASEVFAERTAFPIRSLVGTRFADVVDRQHVDTWTRELETACTGEHAPFEIAYRSTHANQGWIAGTLIPLPPENGEDRVLMIARDVSTEHRSVTARKASSA